MNRNDSIDQADTLVQGLRASGLDPIVIDEDFDFNTLTPRRETNTEFLQRVMNYGCPTGPLVQAFIIEGITRYASDVAKSEGAWDNGLINSTAWKATAVWLQAELKKKYGG